MRSTLRISRVATQIVALFALTSCALLIPDNPSAPRYEVVLGERRVPLENPGGAGATQRSREAAMATQQMQMAQAYPNLNNVPPAPSRADEAQRLMQTRHGLEQQRGVTNGARNQLLNDAAAEPSMLSDLPQAPAYPAQPYPPLTYPVPAAAPMPQQPVAPAYAPRSGLPSTDVITGGPSASSLAGPTPQLAQLPPPIAMDSLPMGGYGGAAAPMQLHQPGAMTTASFDPMANGAMNLTPPGGSSVGSAGYLSPSRYRR